MAATPRFDEADIFNEARHITGPEARRQYLQAACAGNERMLARVEALLRVHVEEQTFLEAPALPRPAAAVREGPGTLIGPYRLQEQIGEGGFGVVFRAEQQPLHRAVAVKILKPGLDTSQVVARFEAERQALALMDHPSIARVLDGGESASGRPFFVMDLVDGIPIARYCDEHQLPLREQLALFIAVCQAVQHAHQKGIIHRDLKPTNVLVTSVNGKPVPKLIDFGVAKALGQRLTERTLVTGVGGVIGTLEYMSPEQADFDAVDIDTRADIYSLGVLLYELLTGTTPLTHDRIKDIALSETLRLIREEDPPRPSIRLSESRGSLPSKSTWRNLDTTRLTKEIRGDLDWIVMKALEKDRDRRYATAGDFAQDLQRFLAGEAILARPPSAAYRLRKFVQRHRGAVLAGAAVTVALVVGTVVATWQAIVATQAQDDALLAAAAENRAQIAAATKEAETQSVLDFVESRIFVAARPEGQAGGLGHDVTLRRALEAALPVVDRSFPNQPLVEARLRRTLGNSFLYLSEPVIATEQFQRAHAIYLKLAGPDDPRTLASASDLASGYRALGKLPQAHKLYEETLARRQAILGPDHVDTLASMNNLANTYDDLGDYTKALQLREETLTKRRAKLGDNHIDTIGSMRNLANSYAVFRRFDDAKDLEEKALALAQATLGPDHADTLAIRNNLALTYGDLHRYEQALKLQEETLALLKNKLGATHHATLMSMLNVAKAHADLNQHEEAAKILKETLALQKINPGPKHQETLHTMYSLALRYHSLDRFEDSLELHQQTWELRKATLGPNHRDTLYSMWGVATNMLKVDRGSEAVPIIDECLQRAAGTAVASRFSGLADKRLRYFEMAKDAAGCRATAEIWERMHCTDSGSLYHAARYRAVTAKVLREADMAPDALKQAEAEADKAMAWLRQAVAAGYANLKNIKQDTDLDALRDRADFHMLVADLEASKAKK